MSGVYDDNGELRYFGLYWAEVVDNADPNDLGRVRFNCPGLVEPESEWAFPAGGSHSSGAKGLGGYDVPPKGAMVLVGFPGGDPNHGAPYYFGGPRGLGDQLSARPATPAKAHELKVYESDRFLIVLNGQGGSEELLVKDKSTGDEVSMKPSRLKVQAQTKVTVVAPKVEIGADGLGANPILNGVVLGSGIDTFTGASYGVLGSASQVVTAKKT